MVILPSEAQQFFRLMWSLQFFVGKSLNLIPDCPSAEAYGKLRSEKKLPIRDALYDHIGLVDRYIQENPENLTAEELAIVQGWKNFIQGDFFIERFLSKHAIFINDKKVYAVLGLYDSFEVFIHPSHLPVYVKAVLLPFKGKIVYDGMFQSYQIHFGGGIRGNLKEDYLKAKQNNQIIESLEGQTKSKKAPKPSKDWSPQIEALLSEAAKLKAGSGAPAIQGSAFALAKASLEMAQVAAGEPEDVEQLVEQMRRVERAVRKVRTTLARAGSFEDY